MVWAHIKINRTCKDDPTGHGTRKEKERQTEKEWVDNISEWTGLGLGEAFRKAEGGEERRKLFARSSLMPQRSFRPRDEWVISDCVNRSVIPHETRRSEGPGAHLGQSGQR